MIADTLSYLYKKDSSPPPSSPDTSSSPPVILKMDTEQYPYLPDWDDMTDDEDETYQAHEFTDDEIVTTFANAVISDNFNFNQYNNEVYEADEELDMEVQFRINLDIEYKLWSSNISFFFLTEVTVATVEKNTST